MHTDKMACFYPCVSVANFFLPNLARMLMHHGLPHFARERPPELRHVRDYAVHAVFEQRMRVGDLIQPLAFWTLITAGPLRHPDEEALIGREAIHRLKILTFCGVLPRQVRQEGST